MLITAAAGGMGLLLVQLAHKAGAHVIGAARGQAKLDLVKAHGADVVIDYSEPGWEKLVLEATERRRASTSRSKAPVASSARPRSAPCKDGGWFSAHGAPSGGFAAYRPGRGRAAGDHREGDHGPAGRHREIAITGEVVHAASGRSGDLIPVIDRTFPLDQLAEAHTAVEITRAAGQGFDQDSVITG